MEEYEQIEAWVQGAMTDTEKARFEKQMQDDNDLAVRARLYKELDHHLRNDIATSIGESALTDTIREAVDERKAMEAVAAKVIPIRRKWLYGVTGIAATVLLVITIRFAMLNTASDPGKLYSQYARFDDLSFTRGGAGDSALVDAVHFFNNKQYDEAIPFLDRYLSLKPGEPEYQLALAYAFIQVGRFAEADSSLSAVAVAKSDFYKVQATWWRALSMLKQGKIKECKALLKSIPAGSDQYPKAMELLSQLD